MGSGDGLVRLRRLGYLSQLVECFCRLLEIHQKRDRVFLYFNRCWAQSKLEKLRSKVKLQPICYTLCFGYLN